MSSKTECKGSTKKWNMQEKRGIFVKKDQKWYKKIEYANFKGRNVKNPHIIVEKGRRKAGGYADRRDARIEFGRNERRKAGFNPAERKEERKSEARGAPRIYERTMVSS